MARIVWQGTHVVDFNMSSEALELSTYFLGYLGVGFNFVPIAIP